VTTTPLDFAVKGDIVDGDKVFISTGFIETYMQLSEEYCDTLFRRPTQALSTDVLIISGPDQAGVSKVRFLLELQGSCRGCTGTESLFDGNRRRMQEEDVVCYCKKGAVSGAPSDQDFQDAFSTYLASGRRLQQRGKFTLLCVGSTCDPLVPTLSPTIPLLESPNGIQNYGGCVVPNPLAVGDGYCDRTVDDNGQPIYNSVECGYDGGDW
jgi:hypothetical protein